MDQVATFGLIGAVIGAVPAILGALIPWLRMRDRISQSNRRIELAKNRVDFIDSWLKGKLSTGTQDESGIKQRAGQHLDEIFESISDVLVPGGSDALPPYAVVSERRSRSAGGGYRAAFFVTFGLFCFLLIGSSIDDTDNFSFTYFLNEIKNEWPLVLFFLAPPSVFFLLWRRTARKAKIPR